MKKKNILNNDTEVIRFNITTEGKQWHFFPHLYSTRECTFQLPALAFLDG